MAETKQPAGITPGATTGDVEDEVPSTTAKSAEDRKAAAALSKLDDTREDDAAGPSKHVDHEELKSAMTKLGGAAAPKKAEPAKDLKKVHVDPADVALLVDQLELTKAEATGLLKAHQGDAVLAMRQYVDGLVGQATAA